MRANRKLKLILLFLWVFCFLNPLCEVAGAESSVKRLMLFRGPGTLRYRVDETLKQLPVAVKNYCLYTFIYAGGNFTTDTPPALSEVNEADIFLLSNFPLEALDREILKAISARVRSGATCIILGGDCALSRTPKGDFPLEDIIPVELPKGWPLKRLPQSQTLACPEPDFSSLNWNWKPELQYLLDVTPKKDAKVIMSVQNQPVLTVLQLEKGSCYLFSGTPFGQNQKGFWKWPDWPAILKYMVTSKY